MTRLEMLRRRHLPPKAARLPKESPPMPITETARARHQITRHRHEVRRRTLTVAAVEQLGPRMRRFTLRSPELHDFVSLGADDHVKLFFGTGADGRPQMRDYTPRRFDTAKGELVIDFALHEAGPATAWAMDARVGDTLEIGGPRGSAVVPDDFDWYLLVGDETALPAIGRRVEELRGGVPVISVVAVDGPADEQSFAARANWTGVWVHRDGQGDDAQALIAALPRPLPAGEGFVWIAAETQVARALRTHVLDALGHRREWSKAAGYWTRGQADAGGRIEE